MIKYTKEFLANAKKQGIEDVIISKFPNCVDVMEPTFVQYMPDELFEIRFPVLEWYLNPFNAMQGGFISAAFDNAYGLLNKMATRKEAVSLDLNTNYHKPIYKNDTLTVKVYMKHKGNTIVNMYAEAFNNDSQLIATSDSKMMIMK